MTTVEQAPEPLLSPSLTFYEFQAGGVAEAYFMTSEDSPTGGGALCTYQTGLGKSILALGLACLLLEDDEVDLVMIACEPNKIKDFVDDFARFSSLTAHKYRGTGRQKRLIKSQPRVVVSTYETLRIDMMKREKVPGKRGKGTMVDGPLVADLDLRGKRILWILDEVTKVRGRSSELHQSFAYMLKELRKGPYHQRVMGMTATPLERDMEDSYNIGRILVPALMPTVASFEKEYTRGVDMFGRYVFRRERFPQFAKVFAPAMIRKLKTDADVMAQFPKMTEKSLEVELHPDHQRLYDAVAEILADEDVSEQERMANEQRSFTLLRMTAGHPRAHLYADNKISLKIVEELGPEILGSITSSKTVELINRLKPLVKGNQEQAIVFSYFGNSVVPPLAEDLRAAGFSVVTYTGSMGDKEREKSKAAFLAGEAEIFLASDAASKGISLGCASYVFEYESAASFATRTQRINRAHRINSTSPTVTSYTMIAMDTIEEGLVDLMLRRNEDSDVIRGDVAEDGSAFVSAADRRVLLDRALKR